MTPHHPSPPTRAVLVGPMDERLLTCLDRRSDVDIVGRYLPNRARAGDVSPALLRHFVHTLRAHLWVLGGAPAAFLRALHDVDPTGRHVALLGPGVRLASDPLQELRTLERETNGKVVPWTTGRYRLGSEEFALRRMGSPHRTSKITRLVAARDAAADPVEDLRELLDTWFSIALTEAVSVKASITRGPNGTRRLVGVVNVRTDYLADPEHAVDFEVRHVLGVHSREVGTVVTHRRPQEYPWTAGLGWADVALMRRLTNRMSSVAQRVDKLSEDEAVDTLVGNVVGATRHLLSNDSGLDLPMPTLEQALRVQRTMDAVRASIETPGRLRFKTPVVVIPT